MGKEINEKKVDNKAGMHIIRRNVKVISTSGQKSEVEQITTKISGEVKKTHQTVDNKNSGSNYNKNDLGVVMPKKPNHSNRPKFGANRPPVIITRNGKPVEQPKPQEKVKVEPVANENVASATSYTQNEEKKVNNPEVKKNNNSNNEQNKNNFNKNNNYSKPYNKDQKPNDKKSFNKPYNNDQNKRNGGFKKFENRDNTQYQVNKFMKQSSNAPQEQKEQREYSNNQIDKKKYENKGSSSENRKEKLDKNKLREQHSRVSTSKLRGMEVDSSSGMLDLYERDTDRQRKRGMSQKKKIQKQEMNQTKIIPMTEVKLPEVMTVKYFAELLKKQASEIIKKLFVLGIMATVNQEIDLIQHF